MRVYVIDAGNNVPEQRRGVIGVDGSPAPSAAEKIDCIETVTLLADQGWTIAARPGTPIGRLAAHAAKTMGVPFFDLNRVGQIPSTRAAVTTQQGVGDSSLTR